MQELEPRTQQVGTPLSASGINNVLKRFFWQAAKTAVEGSIGCATRL
jgi:hypothetical protein